MISCYVAVPRMRTDPIMCFGRTCVKAVGETLHNFDLQALELKCKLQMARIVTETFNPERLSYALSN